MSTPFDSLINNAAAMYELPSQVLHSLIAHESSFNPDAVSSAGAQGLTQLMPGTSASLGVDDPFDPSQSIYGGAAYLSQLVKRFGGDLTKGLEAYNAGPTAVANGTVPQSTVSYAANILSGTQPQSSATTAQQTNSVTPTIDSIQKELNQKLASDNPYSDSAIAGSAWSHLTRFIDPTNFVPFFIGLIFIFVGGLMFVFPGEISSAVKTGKRAAGKAAIAAVL